MGYDICAGGVEMQKEFIDEFVKKCDKGAVEANRAIQELSDVQIIELKAELKAKSIHSEKWSVLFIPFLTSVIAELALIIDMPEANPNRIALIGFVLLICQVAGIVLHGWLRCKDDAPRVRALSYLDDYSKKDQQVERVDIANSSFLETFEQIEDRQRRERELMLIEWEKRRNYVNEQIVLLKNSLFVREENEQERCNETDTRC